MNEHRIRDKALAIMGAYTYEDAQLDGFQERVRVDLKKGFSSVLRKYRDGESDLIRQIYLPNSLSNKIQTCQKKENLKTRVSIFLRSKVPPRAPSSSSMDQKLRTVLQ